MTPGDEIIAQLKRRNSALNTFIAIATPVAVVIAGIFWYFNNVWKPTVVLETVDYEKNIATLLVNGKTRVLYAGSTINAGYSWGVRFAGKQFDNYDRIEVAKNDLVYKTISVKN